MHRAPSPPTLLRLLAPLFFPALAAAQPAPAGTTSPGASTARVTEIEFRDGDVIDGTHQRPEEALTLGHVRSQRPSLVAVRQSFRPELLASADAL